MLIDQQEKERVERAQERKERAEDRKLLYAAIAAFTGPRQLPAETLNIGRVKVGEKVDAWDAQLVRQEGESREDFVADAMKHNERLANRYPLPDGRTHVWPLDKGSDPEPQDLKAQLQATLDAKDASKNQALRGRIAAAKGKS
jgi:hypothetical protein